MADIISHPRSRPGPRPQGSDAGRDAAAQGPDELVELTELLFFAYRDFTGEADAVLGELGFGRAHHRVLHFVARNPGLRVAELLEILQITKQSLARVLKDLIDQGYVCQRSGPQDRRERRLLPTDTGAALAARLMRMQGARIRAALEVSGAAGGSLIRDFLLGMVGPSERREVEARVSRARRIQDRADGSSDRGDGK